MTDIVVSPVGTIPSIPVDAGGLYTPSGGASIDYVAKLINATWDMGNTKFTDFESKVAAVAAEIDAMIAGQVYDITASNAASMTITEPSVLIPSSVEAETIITRFQSESTTQIAALAAQAVSFVSEYFPTEQDSYDAAEAWLTAATTNPDGGLPPAIQAQLLTEDKDRINAEATQAVEAMTATFASRRFPMPPGALASATLQINQKAQDSVAESSRKIMINSIEMMKFAVEKTLSLRQLSMAATLDYVKTMSVGQGVAAQVVPGSFETQMKLISAVSSYYNARTDAQKAISQVEQFNANLLQDADVKNQAANLALVEDKIKALMGEIAALAQSFVALFNNLHATVGLSTTVNAT